ncbi:MAG: serine/threonine protein kinase [Candidatus Melainabacteria bacterium]|nr:serine/threonine protein kinase [Candidatus Melainabacteria bacterium]
MKPRRKEMHGSITQWLSVCNCEALSRAEEQAVSVHICRGCGKRIGGGRSGTLTSMIFRSDLCSCQRPVPEVPVEGFEPLKSAVFGGYLEDDENEDELDLAPEDFPVDRYGPLRELGRGAGGTVYLCRDRLLRKKVAIKVLNVLTDEQLVSFQDEARATSRLDHPYLISILDFGSTSSGAPFMVLEYFPGITLREYLDHYGSMDLEYLRPLVTRVFEALLVAHRQGIFHRDLKPSNLLLRDGENGPDLRIIDFGVARIEGAISASTEFQGRTIVGSPMYMSPDAIMGYQYDQRSELYSVGCIIFEALTGHPPFKGGTALETLSMQVNGEPPLHELQAVCSAEVAEFVRRCIAKQPEDRFATIEEAIDAFSVLGEQASPDRSDSATGAGVGVKRDSFAPAGILVAVLILLLVLLAGPLAMEYQSGMEKPGSPGKKQAIEARNDLLSSSSMDIFTDPEAGRPELQFGPYNSEGPGLVNYDDRRKQLFIANYKLVDDSPLDGLDLGRILMVELRGCSGDRGPVLRRIGRIPNLRFLGMMSCNTVTAGELDALCQGLADSPSRGKLLNSLGLLGSKLEQDGFERLAKMEHLRLVDFSYSVFAPGNLEALLPMRLESINLVGTNLTDDQLMLFVPMKSLKTIVLAEDNGVTAGGIARFSVRRPDCEIRNENFRIGLEKYSK